MAVKESINPGTPLEPPIKNKYTLPSNVTYTGGANTLLGSGG